jgi:UDP-N-acetylglucosamine acyltransferase
VTAAGHYASLYGLNLIGLKRRGFTEETIAALKQVYKIFFRSSLTVAKAIIRARAEAPDLPEVRIFIEFIEQSKRGVTR